jgi:hypothetical protein
MISRRTVERSNNFGKFVVTTRKPTFVRWAEEAEAKQVCEWAGLERSGDRPHIGTERSRASCDRPSFLRRLRGLFGRQLAQIDRDG